MAKETMGFPGFTPFVGFEPPEGVVALQKQFLQAYDDVNAAWLSRVKSEVDLWTELATNLSASASMHEALQNYIKSVAERIQMIAQDGQKLLGSCQDVVQKLGGERPRANI